MRGLIVVALVSCVALADEPKGQRVFTCAHSFHAFVPPILAEIAKKAGVKDHVHVGTSSIGGSRVYQHWNVPEEKNQAKKALTAGKVDVLTMSPIEVADDGIENFAALALKHNPKVRVLVQQSWPPFDSFDGVKKMSAAKVDRDAATAESLKAMPVAYFKALDDHVKALQTKLGSTNVVVAPVGRAVLNLRAKVLDGKVPAVKKQSELFTDPIGHATPPVQVLEGYVYYAMIYGRDPAGLPVPNVLKKTKGTEQEIEALNKVLQEVAWDAVTSHPTSGVKK